MIQLFMNMTFGKEVDIMTNYLSNIFSDLRNMFLEIEGMTYLNYPLDIPTMEFISEHSECIELEHKKSNETVCIRFYEVKDDDYYILFILKGKKNCFMGFRTHDNEVFWELIERLG